MVILFLLILRTSTMLKIFQKHRYFCGTAVLRKSKTVHCYYYLHNIRLHERFVFVNLETEPSKLKLLSASTPTLEPGINVLTPTTSALKMHAMTKKILLDRRYDKLNSFIQRSLEWSCCFPIQFIVLTFPRAKF